VGRIDRYDNPTEPEDSTVLIVDGRRVTKDAFWTMLSQYEGWTLKLQIVDRTEE
jgi:hypothetical protein